MAARDPDEDFEGQFRARARRRKIVVVAIFGGLIAAGMYPCVRVAISIGGEVQESSARQELYSHRATPAQIAAVREATAGAEGQLAARTAAWRAGMAGAATLGVDRSARCPVELPLRQEASAQRGPSIDVNYDHFTAIVFPGQQAFPHDVSHGGVLPSEPPRVRYARERIASLRERITRTGRPGDLEGIVTAARELSTPAFWTYDVVLFARMYQPPRADATGMTFDGGGASGVSVLYDYASARPLCAGDVEATTTSTDVQYNAQVMQAGQTLQSMLDAEFAAELERAIASGTRFGVASAITPP